MVLLCLCVVVVVDANTTTAAAIVVNVSLAQNFLTFQLFLSYITEKNAKKSGAFLFIAWFHNAHGFVLKV